MKQEQKNLVRKAIVRYVEYYHSVIAAAASLDNVCATQIEHIINNEKTLKDTHWQHIAQQVGLYMPQWKAADTSAGMLLRILMGDAQRYAMNYGISMSGGLGKTFTAGLYARCNESVVYIAGNADYNRKSFLTELLSSVGGQANGSAPNLLRQLVCIIAAKEQPLLIIDDAHLLKDRVLHLLVVLANSLTGKAGIMLMGNEELRPRIIEGVRTGRLGFEEIFQTIGRRFITLSHLAPTDVAAVCRANGVHDEGTIDHICSNSHNSLHTATFLIQQCTELRIAA